MAASASDARFAALAVPALMREFGRAVTRRPRGVTGAAVSVTAMWSPDETPTRQADSDGEATTLGGYLEVLAAQEVHRDDVWVIDGREYACMGEPSAASGGLRRVNVTSVEKVGTTRHRPGEMY